MAAVNRLQGSHRSQWSEGSEGREGRGGHWSEEMCSNSFVNKGGEEKVSAKAMGGEVVAGVNS